MRQLFAHHCSVPKTLSTRAFGDQHSYKSQAGRGKQSACRCLRHPGAPRLPGRQAHPPPLDCAWVAEWYHEGSIDRAKAAMMLTKGQMLDILQLGSLPVLDLTAEQQLVHEAEENHSLVRLSRLGASASLMAHKCYFQRGWAR